MKTQQMVCSSVNGAADKYVDSNAQLAVAYVHSPHAKIWYKQP